MVLAPTKTGAMNMTKLTNEVCELNSERLDQVSGGFTMGQKIRIAREEAALRMEVREHEITPAQAASTLQAFEFRTMLQGIRFI
jgi:hypothetical protein